jgi:DNA-binding CsgD family transcriptional regulator
MSEAPPGSLPPGLSPEECDAAIATAFGLTPTEAKVARVCIEVPDVATVASTVGISQHTVHSHLSRIYLKAKVNSRLQLAVLVTAALWRVASKR